MIPARVPPVLCCVALAVPAQVVVHAPQGAALLAADAAVERLATGRQFLEGPVWLPARGALLCSDIPAGERLSWSEADGLTVYGPSAHSNGHTLDRQGRLVSCQHEARDVVRQRADGTWQVLVDRHDGRRLHSPNDVAVRADGSVWFTDPTYGLGRRPKEQDGNFVYRLDPDSGELRVVQRDFDQPNGLCFAPDHDLLYVADSGSRQRIGAFPVLADGTLASARFWIDAGADGVRCDARGHLWTAARDGVRAYAADGTHLLTLRLPEQPSNLAFGGADGRQLFVTARTSLYRVRVAVAGAPFPPPPASPASPTAPADR